MKNNNELKPLFRNVDLVANPIKQFGSTSDIIELESFYNNINDSIIQNMVYQRPVNKMDVNLIRDNLCKMFKYRVENNLKNSLNILEEDLRGMEIKIYKFLNEHCEAKYPNVKIGIGSIYNINKLVEDIINDFPYIIDLPFYFDIDSDFQFIKTLALAISSKLYNMLTFHIGVDNDLFDKDMLDVANECINSLFRKFANFMIENLHVIIEEARTVYFTSGDYVIHESEGPMHYIMQEEYLNKAQQPETKVMLISDDEQEKLDKLLESLEGVF